MPARSIANAAACCGLPKHRSIAADGYRDAKRKGAGDTRHAERRLGPLFGTTEQLGEKTLGEICCVGPHAAGRDGGPRTGMGTNVS